MSLLFDAVLIENVTLDYIQALLTTKNFSIDYQHPDTGETALKMALSTEREDIAVEIIRHGANVELTSRVDFMTPLEFACRKKLPFATHEIVIRTSRSELIRLKDEFWGSILAGVVLNENVATAEYILAEFGEHFSVNDNDESGNQVLHEAASRGIASATQWLISHGAVVDGHGEGGTTPLMYASMEGHVDVARILIQAGADVDSGHVSMFRRFFFWGRTFVLNDYDRIGQNVWTPLMFAASEGHALVARELLLGGANPRRLGLDGYDSRSIALLCGGADEFVRLLDAWGSIQALWVIRSAGQVHHRGENSSLKRLPKDLCRMLGSLMV
jgi:ankyrin repeat protein